MIERFKKTHAAFKKVDEGCGVGGVTKKFSNFLRSTSMVPDMIPMTGEIISTQMTSIAMFLDIGRNVMKFKLRTAFKEAAMGAAELGTVNLDNLYGFGLYGVGVEAGSLVNKNVVKNMLGTQHHEKFDRYFPSDTLVFRAAARQAASDVFDLIWAPKKPAHKASQNKSHAPQQQPQPQSPNPASSSAHASPSGPDSWENLDLRDNFDQPAQSDQSQLEQSATQQPSGMRTIDFAKYRR